MLESKNELRRKIKAIFRTKNAKDLDCESKIIMQKLEESQLFISAEVVALYHSLPDEPCTHDFIAKWASKKTILLPVVRGDQMFFSAYNIGMSFDKGSFNILEPHNPQEYPGAIDLVVVPALAYDSSHFRLGRGKGYYDKYFALHPALARVGVCFSYQYLSSIPSQSHDIGVDELIYVHE